MTSDIKAIRCAYVTFAFVSRSVFVCGHPSENPWYYFKECYMHWSTIDKKIIIIIEVIQLLWLDHVLWDSQEAQFLLRFLQVNKKSNQVLSIWFIMSLLESWCQWGNLYWMCSLYIYVWVILRTQQILTTFSQ